MNNDLSRKRFLVVDDFPEFRKSLRSMVQTFGAVQIDDAGTGQAALELMEKRTYDVVLCDYNLGHNQKDGQQVLEEIKHKGLLGVSAIFIMITAETLSDMVMAVVEYQPDDYLIKPFTKEVLRSRIEKAARRKINFQDMETALRRKDYYAALEFCDREIERQPHNLFEYLKIKADLHMKTGDFAGAEAVYNEIIEMRDLPWARLGTGKAAFMAGDYGRAREILLAVIQENRMNMEAYDWLSKTYMHLENTQEAQNILETAVKISPKSFTRQKMLGEVAFRNKDFGRSEVSFRDAIRYGKHSCLKTPSVYTGLASTFVNNDKSEEAISVLNEIKQEFRDNSEAAFQAAAMKGVVYRKMNRDEDARKSIEEAAKIHEASCGNSSGEIMLELARTCMELGQAEEGLKLLEEVVKNNHEDEGMLHMVEDVLKDAGLKEKGKEIISQARDEIIRVNNQGVRLVEEGRLEEAIQCFEKAVAAVPRNKILIANATHTILLLLQQNGKDSQRLGQAYKFIESIKVIDPDYKKLPTLTNLYARISSK